MPNYQVHKIRNFDLQCGEKLPEAVIAYQTYGELNPAGDNVVVLPTFYTGTHVRNEGFFGAGRAIDPARHFIVSVNLMGNGYSSSPDNTPPPFDGPRFPTVTLYDNIRAQHDLITGQLRVKEIALVTGWSMAGCQSFQWAAQYPEMVGAILPFCGSAKTSEHNHVFLEGVKAALMADCGFRGGDYKEPPRAGLMAFARIYAGWAFSQAFYRKQLYKNLGFDSTEALLQDWERDHLEWDANNLLCKLKTWQLGDISANDTHDGDLQSALSAIRAKTIIISCDNDLYFRPADNEQEVTFIPHGEHRVYSSPWGHCVASPGNDPEFAIYLDSAIRELLD